jgi:hypothetical protein
MERLETEADSDFGFVAEAIVASGYNIVRFRGTLDEELASTLRGIPHAGSFSHISTAVLKGLWTVVYEDFWKPRCEDTIEAERALSITKEAKRSYVPIPRQSVHRVTSTALKLGYSAAGDQYIWSLAC